MIFFKGVANPEGPVCLNDGSWVFTEMDAGAISWVDADGSKKQVIAKTGLPNGLTTDQGENIWVADALWRKLLKVTRSGDISEISGGSQELPFLLPNDLCFGPDGLIYLTDSGILLEKMREIGSPDQAYQLNFDGRVFQINPNNGACILIDRGFRLTNGIAFGPGGTYLYVAETITGNIYRREIVNGEAKGSLEFFCNVMLKPPMTYGRVAGPDGMAFDEDGNLYVAVLIEGNITIVDPSGKVTRRIDLEGKLPTNLAFDRPGTKRMLVTEAERNELLMIDTPQNGLPLFQGSLR